MFGFVTRIRAQRCQMVQTDVRLRVFSLFSFLEISHGAASSSPPLLSIPADAVRVHLPGAAGALSVRRHRAGGDLSGVPSGQTLRPLSWRWLQWSGGGVQGLSQSGHSSAAFSTLSVSLSRSICPASCLTVLFSCSILLPYSQKLTSIKIQNDKMRTGNLPANMKKNRVLQIIPCECDPARRSMVPR